MQGLLDHHMRSPMETVLLAEALCLHLDATLSFPKDEDAVHPKVWQTLVDLLMSAARLVLPRKATSSVQPAAESAGPRTAIGSKRQKLSQQAKGLGKMPAALGEEQDQQSPGRRNSQREPSLDQPCSDVSSSQEPDSRVDESSELDRHVQDSGSLRMPAIQQWAALQEHFACRARWWDRQHFSLAALLPLELRLQQQQQQQRQQQSEHSEHQQQREQQQLQDHQQQRQQDNRNTGDGLVEDCWASRNAIQVAQRAGVAAFLQGNESAFLDQATRLVEAAACQSAVQLVSCI